MKKTLDEHAQPMYRNEIIYRKMAEKVRDKAMKGIKNKKSKLLGEDSEKQLDEYKSLFQILFDNVCSGVAIYEAVNEGEDFIIVDFNHSAEEIEHVKKEQITGKLVTQVFPGVNNFGILDVFRRVYKTGTPEHLPISIYRDDRITGWRENYVFRLPSKHIVAVYDDISARKRTEMMTRMTDQCFRAIANYSYDWETWIGPTGRMLWTNPAVTRITGYGIQEIMMMTDFPQHIVFEQDRQRINRAFHSAVKGSTGHDIRFKLQRKDGRMIQASMSWQPIFDDEGNSLGHRESIRDLNHNNQDNQAQKNKS
jgi:PAS domain S-box-containing protein